MGDAIPLFCDEVLMNFPTCWQCWVEMSTNHLQSDAGGDDVPRFQALRVASTVVFDLLRKPVAFCKALS